MQALSTVLDIGRAYCVRAVAVVTLSLLRAGISVQAPTLDFVNKVDLVKQNVTVEEGDCWRGAARHLHGLSLHREQREAQRGWNRSPWVSAGWRVSRPLTEGSGGQPAHQWDSVPCPLGSLGELPHTALQHGGCRSREHTGWPPVQDSGGSEGALKVAFGARGADPQLSASLPAPAPREQPASCECSSFPAGGAEARSVVRIPAPPSEARTPEMRLRR